MAEKAEGKHLNRKYLRSLLKWMLSPWKTLSLQRGANHPQQGACAKGNTVYYPSPTLSPESRGLRKRQRDHHSDSGMQTLSVSESKEDGRSPEG